MRMGLFLTLLIITFLVSVVTLGCINKGVPQKEDIVVTENKIPPIDARAPAMTETATFALG